MIKATLRGLGILLVVGVGGTIYFLNEQISDIDSVCALFPVGAPVGDLTKIEADYSVQFMGIFTDNKKPGTQKALFCASLTLCDTSCSVEFKNNKVTASGVVKF